MLRLRAVHVMLGVAVMAAMVCGCSDQSVQTPETPEQPTAIPVGDQGVPVTTLPAGGADAVGGDEEVSAYLACDPDALPFAIPRDATRCQHLDVVTNYFTALSTDQVIQFYVDSLREGGWQRKDDGTIPNIGMWIKDEAQLNIVAAPQEGLTAVQVQQITAAP